MPSTAFDLLRDTASAPAPAAPEPVSQTKQQEVSQASSEIRTQLSGINFTNAAVGRLTNAGVTSAPAIEQDLARLSYDEIEQKYGADVANTVASAAGRYRQQISGERSAGQVAGDTAIGVGSGLFAGLGGIAALGAGLVSDTAGPAVARGVQSVTNALGEAQSQDLQNRRGAFQIRNALNSRDTAQAYDQRDPEQGWFMPAVRQIGTDAVNVVGSALTDPAVAGDIIANAVGSFGAAGAVGKGIQIVGRAAPIVARNAGTLGIGATEAAGGYQQTAAEVSTMEPAALQAGSQHYRDLISQGWTHEAARDEVANRTGLLSAGLTAPAALAAGKLVNQFQMNPMRVPNLMGGLANIGKETLEEALQGGVGAVAQNAATNLVADDTRNLRQGVGEQIGLGALGGFGAAGVMQAPGAAALALGAAARGAGNVAVSAIDRIGERADAVRAANEAASPVSNDNARAAVQAAVAQVQTPEAQESVRQVVADAVPVDAAPEAQERLNSFVETVSQAMAFNPERLAASNPTPAIAEVLTGIENNFDLVNTLSDVIKNADSNGASQEDVLFASQYLVGIQDEFSRVGAFNPENLSLLEGTPAKSVMDEFMNAAKTAMSSPAFKKAMAQSEAALTKAQKDGALTQDVTPETLATPEGQRAAQVAAAAAIVSPEGANLKTVTQMLAHSVGEAPKLRLTPTQRNSLLAVKALLDAEQKTIEAQERLGHSQQIGRVSKEILTDDKKANKVSALSQAKAIANAMRNGDVRSAKLEMRTLGLLVRHMQNKVKAYNQHFEQGGGPNVPYQALSLYNRKPGVGAWYTNTAGHGVHPTDPKSIEQAQRTALEAQRLVEVYNGLSEGFPDLGGMKATPVPLDPRLVGKPEAVAAEFKASKRTNAAKPTEESAAPKSEPKKDVPAKTTANKPAAPAVSDEEAAAIDKAEQDAILAENAEADARFAAEDRAKAEAEAKKNEKPAEATGLMNSAQITSNDSALEHVFNGSELAKVGTLEEYKAYLRAYMSNSAFKGLLFHYTESGSIAKEQKHHKEEQMLFFFSTVKNAQRWADWTIRGGEPKGRILMAVANLNPETTSIISKDDVGGFETVELTVQAVKNGNDAIVIKNVVDFGTVGTQVGINHDNYMVLGTSQDVKAFQAWVAAAAAPAPKETIDTAFPELLGSSLLKTAFKLPKEQLSRVFGEKSPLNIVRQVLSSPESLAKFLDEKGKRKKLSDETAQAYQTHLKDANKIIQTMEKNFQTFVKERLKGDPATIEKDPRLLIYPNTKMVNIADEVDGELKLNRQLLESAVLAGMQWILVGQQMSGREMESEDLSDMLGLPEDMLGSVEEIPNWFNQTVSLSDATRQLSDKITQYWGLRGDSSVDNGLVKGIPEAVAKEIIRAMAENDIIVQSDVRVATFTRPHNPWESEKSSTDLVTFMITENGDPKNFDVVVGDRAEWTAAAKDEKNQKKVFPRLKLPELTKKGEKASDNALNNDLSLIERVVLTQSEDIAYFPSKNQKPPVATHQMNNPMVPHTAADIAQITAHSAVEFKPNMPVIELFAALDETGVQELFGHGNLEGRKLNKNHELSMRGKNLSLLSAHLQIFSMMQRITAVAGEVGKEVWDTGVNYAFNVAKNGRLQMLGRFTPQSSKTMREALVSTWSTLDLDGNRDHIRAYQLALGQALGVKVHQMPFSIASEKTDEILSELEPVVKLLRGFLDAKTLPLTAVAAIKDGFTAAQGKVKGVNPAITAIAIHALLDVARRQQAEETGGVEALKSFRTGLSLEADGVTNGVINAINIMSTGQFTGPQIRNMAKGGRFFITDGPGTMNEQMSADGADMYKEGQKGFETLIKNARENLLLGVSSSDKREAARSKAVLEIFDQTMILLNTMFPKGDITFDETTGDLEIGRNVMKNPMTISIYGSGNGGIAEKVVKVVADAMYERMSNVAELQNLDPDVTFRTAFFANLTESDEEAEARFDRFFKAFDAVTNTVINKGKNGLYTEKKPAKKAKGKPTDFTLTSEQIANMRQNVLRVFVDPMAVSIRQALGESVFDSGKLIIKATQIQSVFLEDAYQRAVDAKLAELKEKDPTRTKYHYLSDDQQKEIFASLKHLEPLIETGTQTFYFAGKTKADKDTLTFSTDLLDRQSTPAFINAPAKLGVAAMPGLNIGMGDGRAIQVAQNTGHFKRSLGIFDGVHGPLDTIDEDSRILNEAVYTSWQGNPLLVLHKTYSSFLEGSKNEPISDKLRQTLSRMLTEEGDDVEVLSEDTIRQRMEWVKADLLTDGMSAAARQMTMAEMSQKIDQMAATGAPYVKVGKDLKATTYDAAAEEMNEDYQRNLAKLYKKAGLEQPKEAPAPKAETAPTTPTKTTPKSVGRLNKATGVRVISALELTKAMRVGVPEIFDLIRRTRAASGYTVVYGTPEQLQAYSVAKGLSLPIFTEGTKGLTVPSESVIYLTTKSMETIAHEMIHAATFEKVLAIIQQLNNPNGGETTEEGEAVLRLQGLMNQFLEMESQGSELTPEARKAYRDAVRAIQGHLGSVDNDLSTRQALALNEFMAWSLSNKDIAAKLSKTKANPLVQLTKDALVYIKKLILGRTVVSKPGTDMLSNINFNTAIIVRSQPTVLSSLSDLKLAHQTSPDADPRLSAVLETFTRVVSTHLNSNPVDDLINRQSMSNAVNQAVAYSRDVRQAGFSLMTPQAAATFEIMVATLATQAEIDPAALAKAQELFAHVTKDLTPQDLMSDPSSTDPNDLARAEAQWDILVGKQRTKLDRQGRSALLPIFLALATVDDNFRAFLSKKGLPKGYKNEDRSLDALLENTASTLMSKLSDHMAGTTRAKNIQQAIDALSNQIQRTAMEHKTLLDYVVTPVGSMTDKANEKVTEMLQGAAAALTGAAERLDAKASNSLTKTIASFARLTEAAVNESKANELGEQTVARVYDSRMWAPVKKLVSDLVGRTLNNADIFDMIKQVRSMVSQSRQRYREDLPRIIASKFKRKLSESEWSDLFHGMAENDLAVLAQSMKHDEIFKLFADNQLLTKSVKDLEKDLASKAGRDWKRMQEKAEQLANFIKTKEAGTFLLKNAAAIASLAGLNGGRAPAVSKDAAFVADLDKLITLYTIQDLDQRVRQTVSSLAQTEKEGLSFTLAFLEGQRKEEMTRVANSGRAQMNHYKGYIPSLPENGVSLIVSDDENYSDLAERSYKRIGDYVGSSADYAGPNASKRGYYMAQTSTRSPYNQGILQNVNQTASGVEAETGFTDGPVAGRIRSPQSVQAITKRLLGSGERAPGNENLMPVFNSMGRVVAYERALDPKISAKVKKDTHLAKMIGVWRGRQVEEGIATQVNIGLVDRTFEQYKKDMLASAVNASQYVNIFDPKVQDADPVLRDAIELMPDDIRAYAQSKFGEGKFFVRKDLLDDTLGYRNASIGDAWNGVTRWDPKVQEVVKKLAISMMGNEAYRRFVNAEEIIQGVVKDLRVLIVVKSVVVPVANAISNMHHLLMRGVSPLDIARGMPRKLTEIQSYVTNRVRDIELEAELRAAESSANTVQANKIRAERRAIADANKRMTIWPLIEAGEFSAISDAGISRDEILLTSGKLNEYIEKQLSKLPGPFETMARYGMITRDTALFQGLQKAVDYGDFIAKAILFDSLTKKKGKTQKQALAQITEEFVNYDRLPGRFRGTLEDMGLLWFYNFKIRSVKVALSVLRNNPVHALLATSLLPDPGTVLGGNLISKGLAGGLPYSIGPGMGVRALGLNPWANLVF